MNPVRGATVLEQLNWRYATKKFDSERKISSDDWQVLEQSLVLSPSSFGMQPWKFFVVTNPELKARLSAASWGQTQPQDCSHMVVMALRDRTNEQDADRLIQRTADVRNIPVDSLDGFRKMLVGFLAKPPIDINEWAARQVYIAIGQLMACAAMMGIDTCPMEGIDPRKYDEILEISAHGYRTCVGCAAGYRAPDDKYSKLAKVRFPTTDVVEFR